MSGSQPFDTGTATGRLMLAVIGAVAQAAREAMLERQGAGVAKAKARRGTANALCRPLGGKAPPTRSQRVSSPRKSPASWGSAGPASYRALGASRH